MVLAKAILLLGSNLGDRNGFLQSAISEIQSNKLLLRSKSSIYETAPWGKESKNGYLNQAVIIETSLQPHVLLEVLQKIEIDLGRTRNIRWEDRVIDIDILLYESEIIHSPTLTIPHPEMQNRRFALIPICEIANDWVHPVFQNTMIELLMKCSDKGAVSKPDRF